MRRDDLRDEAAQELVSRDFLKAPGPEFLDLIEEVWQEVHAEEQPYESLEVDYYTGLAEMILRVSNCWIDEVRARCEKRGKTDLSMAIQAMAVQAMKVKIETR